MKKVWFRFEKYVRSHKHCVEKFCIRIFSSPYFPAFGLYTERYKSVQMQENTDQKNSECGHFSRSEKHHLGTPLKHFRKKFCFAFRRII